MVVVSEARRILSYHEHLTEEQRPPPSLWHSVRKCTEYIDAHRPGRGGDPSLTFADHEVED